MKQRTLICPLILISWGFFLSNSFAQHAWSLEECIRHAYANNLQLKKQALEAQSGHDLVFKARMGMLPAVNGNIWNGLSTGRALDQTTYQFGEGETVYSGSLNASASVDLFHGFQRVNALREHQINLQSSLAKHEQLQHDIALNIAAAYLHIILSSELLVSAANQADITRMQTTRAQALVEAGSLARSGLLEIQAQLAAEEVQVVTARNQLDLSYLVLKQYLELGHLDNFRIVIPEISIVPVDHPAAVEQLFSHTQTWLPLIKAAELRLSAAEKGVMVARGGRSPRISLTGAYYTGFSNARQRPTGFSEPTLSESTSGLTSGGEAVRLFEQTPQFVRYPLRNQYADNASTSVSLSISVPFFNGWQVNTAVRRARISVLEARYDLEISRNMLYKEIQMAWADAQAALKKYLASEEALKSMEESFEYTQQRFEVGMLNSVDYNMAKNRLADTRSELLRAKYEYLFKLKILDFYQGKPITI